MLNCGSQYEERMCFISCLIEVDSVCKKLRDDFLRIGLKNHIFAVELLLREALNNAVVHGCGVDSGKRVECSIVVTQDRITITVSDEGHGFDWRVRLGYLPDPASDRGRGMAIMTQYADKVEFNEKGNAVILTRMLARDRS